MKTLLATAAAMLVLAAPAMADPAVGTWQTQVDDGAYAYVDLNLCGEAICGNIARTFKNGGDEYQSPNLGRQIVINMVPSVAGKYKGQVWRPSNDKIYKGDMTVEGDTLKLRGCVGFCTPLTSATQTWTRVN